MKKFIAVMVVAVWLSAGVAQAADATGKYTFSEKGFKGFMQINDQGRYFSVHIETTDKANGQQCLFDAMESGPRDNDSYPAVATSDGGAKFKLKFSKDGKTANVEVETKGEECGMTGFFGGKYIKSANNKK